eukprot:CAMPEP_0194762848 /NCGR_PEP_ID=MMETSP0323_2-20130528/17045_1 /TAXON_ID=2866 ORGANISM="Crypthecodinium cohnii, Strain Seligo" /NCGR_SAMPLE_ID=MMETSP0323_2 /ASSEMBLY_ACC=CAM_ASM_000346 /LENGTH=44 /DNA_ID= /DNA_START= /DNA_END= /DNA_ORIENTATION=
MKGAYLDSILEVKKLWSMAQCLPATASMHATVTKKTACRNLPQD